MTVATRDLRRAVSEWEAAHSSTWPIPGEVALLALSALDIPAHRINELLLRYVGEHTSTASVARGLAQTVNPRVNFDGWPFTHTNWDQAAADAGIGDGESLLCVQGRFWFDAVPDVLYERPVSDLNGHIRRGA